MDNQWLQMMVMTHIKTHIINSISNTGIHYYKIIDNFFLEKKGVKYFSENLHVGRFSSLEEVTHIGEWLCNNIYPIYNYTILFKNNIKKYMVPILCVIILI